MSDNYLFHRGGPALHHLRAIAESGRMLLHGIGLNVAGHAPLDREYLTALRDLAAWTKPLVVSDHLCFTKSRSRSSFDLLPIPYGEEMLAHVAARVDQAQEILGRQLSLENVSSYVRFAASTLTETEFLAELCRRTGCGVLLDVNNAYVSAHNHGGDPWDAITTLAPGQVTQYHFAGHSVEDGYLLDTHDKPVRDEVFLLLERAYARFGPRPFVLERDDEAELPPLLAELAAATRLLS
jgi:uncharacterized protein (UPF0276 family)